MTTDSSDRGSRLARDAVVNLRGGKLFPALVIDGEPFPFLIDKAIGIQVHAHENNMQIVTVGILVDRSVTVTDHSVGS